MDLSAGLLDSVSEDNSVIEQLRAKVGKVSTVQKAGSARAVAENGFKERIKKLLISGAAPADVSKAVGVTESYISQLMKDDAFATEVQSGRAGNAVGKTSLNAQYDRVEEKLLTKLENAVGGMYKTNDILNALRIVGGKKREPIVAPPPMFNGSQVVHLHLSSRVAEKFIVNSKKNVIGLGDSTFIPMSSLELLKEARDGIEEEVLDANKILEMKDSNITNTNAELANAQNLQSRDEEVLRNRKTEEETPRPKSLSPRTTSERATKADRNFKSDYSGPISDII